MAHAQDAINLARSKLGYGEGPRNNETMFGAWTGTNFQPWCDAFVSWIYDQVGVGIGKQAYCPTTVIYWRNKGRLFTTPQPGDQVIYFWNGQYAHTGLVESVDGDYIITIEGNTNGAGSAEGGAVLRKRRLWKGQKTVFGRPEWAPDSASPTPTTFKTYNPPIVFPPIVADWESGSGLVLVGDNGAAYAFFGAEYPGANPPVPDGRHHDPYRLEPVVDALKNPNGPGGWLLSASGSVYALSGAPYLGGTNGKDFFKGYLAWGMVATPDGRYKIFSTADPHGPGYGPDGLL